MQSKKRTNNKTSNYILSMGSSPSDLDKTSSTYLGKLRSNFMGTEFQVFDTGASPLDSAGGGTVRRELAVVTYAANVLGSRGPRKMQVGMPVVSEDGQLKSHHTVSVFTWHVSCICICTGRYEWFRVGRCGGHARAHQGSQLAGPPAAYQ
jgi:hypothetical protein